MPRPKSYQPQQALESAMHVFWRRGFEATSVSDLAKATGLNRKSLYNEFSSKESLFEQALAHYAEQARQQWEVCLGASPAGLDNILRLIEYVPKMATPRGCFFAVAASEAPQISARSREIVNAAYQDLEHHFLLNLLAAGPNSSEYTERCSELAAGLVVIFIGMPSLARLQEGQGDVIKRTCRWLIGALRQALQESGEEGTAASEGPGPSLAPDPVADVDAGEEEGFLAPD